LKLYLTPDFLSEILSYGEKVKVLKPLSLIDQVKNSLKNSSSNYNDIY
jgi:predicted DNA-binding transcriptional regulator YafY